MMKRWIVTLMISCLAFGTPDVSADEVEVEFMNEILRPHCAMADSQSLDIASQRIYWMSAESRLSATKSSSGEKKLVDRWFFDRASVELGYSLNGSYRISDYPDRWTREDKPYVAFKYVLPLSTFREAKIRRDGEAARAAERNLQVDMRKAAFYAAFLQFRADLAKPEKKIDALKQALAIAATSDAFAEECLNPSLL